jgi:hypothetical protein
MWWVRTNVKSPSEALAVEALSLKVSTLEDNAARAGYALACTYANSGEYEAELIAARRRAGVYGPKHGPWISRIMAIASGLLVVVGLILVTN